MWAAFRGSRGQLQESLGKVAGKIFPNREMLHIPGFQAPGKVTAANLGLTLPGTLSQPSMWGVLTAVH